MISTASIFCSFHALFTDRYRVNESCYLIHEICVLFLLIIAFIIVYFKRNTNLYDMNIHELCPYM